MSKDVKMSIYQQRYNRNMRAVVRQMRRDMYDLERRHTLLKINNKELALRNTELRIQLRIAKADKKLNNE
jgi:hypothetical protein